MKNNCVKHMMEDNLATISPDATLEEACKKMKETNCGCLPVGTKDKAEGMITDRDIVIRAIAEGRNPAEEKVRDYMSDVVKTCSPDETVAEAAGKMREHGVSRLVVMDGDNKTCGIITFGRLLRNSNDEDEIVEIVACATGKKGFMPGKGTAGAEPRAEH